MPRCATTSAWCFSWAWCSGQAEGGGPKEEGGRRKEEVRQVPISFAFRLSTFAFVSSHHRYEVSALLLAPHPGPRRIRPPGAGGGCRRLRGRRPDGGGRGVGGGGDDAAQGGSARRAPAVRAAFSQSRHAGDCADRQHP